MASLHGLPCEILNRIAQCLMSAKIGFEDNGICNLRLTCRGLCLKTQYEFGRAAFSTLRLDLHPKTLQRFLTICQCPSFGKAVKKIVFAHFGDEYISFPDVEEDEPDADLDEKRSSRFERHVQFVLRKILKQGFGGMKNLQEVVMVTPYAARFHQSQSMEDLARKGLSEGNTDFPALQITVTADLLFAYVAEAAIQSETHLTKFEITKVTLPYDHRFYGVFSIYDQTFARSIPALSHLEQLKLNLYVGGIGKTNPGICHFTDRARLSDMLNTMQQLTSLDILFGVQYIVPANSPSILKAMRYFGDVQLPSLKILKLMRAAVLQDALAMFLVKHEATLGSLHCYDVQIAYEGSWYLILSIILDDMLVLNELRLEHVRQGPKRLFTTREGMYQSTFTFLGREAVVDGIKVIRAHSYLRDGWNG